MRIIAWIILAIYTLTAIIVAPDIIIGKTTKVRIKSTVSLAICAMIMYFFYVYLFR